THSPFAAVINAEKSASRVARTRLFGRTAGGWWTRGINASAHDALMRIVLATWGSFGDLHPYLALALELKRRGHAPVIASIPIYKEKVERVGIEFHPVRPDFPPYDQMMDTIRRAVDAHEGPRTIFREMIAPHFRETYEDTLAAVEGDGGAD